VPVALPPALDGDGTRDGLSIVDGTSFASPIVAGLASWLIAARPGLAPSQYADLLRATARSAGAWSAKSGFGLPDLGGALTAPVPAADRYEPNDAIDQVDGVAYSGADPYRSGTLKATIAPVEDPADVYRIRVRARGRATATLTGGGGAKLYVYAGTARAFNNTAGGKMKVSVRNATNKARAFYVAVREPATAKRAAVSSTYTLKLARR
jgi:subtilisin family serine protease